MGGRQAAAAAVAQRNRGDYGNPRPPSTPWLESNRARLTPGARLRSPARACAAGAGGRTESGRAIRCRPPKSG